jgi:hypothetical protein
MADFRQPDTVNNSGTPLGNEGVACDQRLSAPPPSLAEAAAQFIARHPWLADCEEAWGACEWASGAFAGEVAGAEVVYLLGSRISFPDRASGWRHYPALDPDLYHAACRIGEWYFDPSRRQFDPACEHPFLRHREAFERGWAQCSATPLI